MAVALQHAAREGAAADDEHALAELLELLDQGDEVGVAADDREPGDVRPGERHLEGVDDQVDVGAVLVAARGYVALHHVDRVIRQGPAVHAGARPVPVGALGNHLTPLLERLQDEGEIEFRAGRRLDADLDVVEVDVVVVDVVVVI